jgi:hypothetical protein
MLTKVRPFLVETRVAEPAAERAAAARTRVTPNTLIVLAGIAVLVAALIFLELRIRHLATDFSVVRQSGITNEKQP